MTFIYWGGHMTGKAHLRRYARVNSKSYGKLLDKFFINYNSKCHVYNYPWYECTFTTDVYHKRKDEDYIRVTSDIDRRIANIFVWNENNNMYVNPGHVRTKSLIYLSKSKENEVYFTDEELRKYSSLKYANTKTYYEIISRGTHRFKRDIDRLLEPLSYTDIKTDILFGCVDIFDEDYVRSCKNIIPYKENIHDSCVEKLDSFGDFCDSKYGRDVYLAYKNDPEIVFNYLDRYVVNKGRSFERKLQKKNISYEFFNLDKDNYNDVFKLGSIELPRDMTASTLCTATEELHKERRNHLIEIADKWCDDRKITDVRL